MPLTLVTEELAISIASAAVLIEDFSSPLNGFFPVALKWNTYLVQVVSSGSPVTLFPSYVGGVFDTIHTTV